MSEDSKMPELPESERTTVQKTGEALEALNARLSYAARMGNFEDIKECLDEGADIDTRTSAGRTPLWSTVYWNEPNSSDVVKLLLERGAALELRDSDGETPLWRAAVEGNSENVKLLLKKGADMTTKDNSGASVLFEAISRGTEEIVGILLDAGADTTAKSKSGASVLFEAVSRDRDEIVKLLLNAEVDIEARGIDGTTPLWQAMQNKKTGCANLLLGHGADFRVRDKNGRSLIFEAAAMGIESILKPLLLDDHEDIDSKDENNRTVLWHVISSGNQTCVDLVLGLNPSSDVRDTHNSSLFHEAARAGNEKVLQYLLSKTAEADLSSFIEGQDFEGHTPLWLAVDHGDVNFAKVFLSLGANVDAQRNDKISVLHQAVRNGDFAMVQLLLDGGEDVGSLGGEPGAKIQSEAKSDHKTVIRTQHPKPNINTKDENGDSPLLRAFTLEKNQIRELLVLKGADLEISDNDGETVLWQAVNRENEADVKFLLNTAANVNAQNNDGVSILHQAVKKNNLDLVKLMLGEASQDNRDDGDSTTAGIAGQDGEASVGSHKHISQPISQTAFVHAELNVNTKDKSGESPLLSAVMIGSKQIVDLLVARKPNFDGVDLDGDSELGRATYHGYKEIVEVLLQAGANPEKSNNDGRTPLYWAAWGGFTEIGRLLLAKHVDMTTADTNGETPLYCAVYGGHIPFIKLLLETSAVTSSKKRPENLKAKTRLALLEKKFATGGTILHVAASQNHEEVIELLLDSKVDMTVTDKNGATALHVAVEESDESSFDGCKVLLSRMNAKTIGIKNCNGDTALHLACRLSKSALVEEFLSKNSHISRDTVAVLNDNNETALSISIQEQSLDILQILISYEADVKYVYEDEIEWATMEGPSHDIIAAQALLDDEAIIQTANEMRIKVLNWAARNGCKALAEKILLAEKGEAGQALYWAAVGGQKLVVKYLFELCEEEPRAIATTQPSLKSHSSDNPIEELSQDIALTLKTSGERAIQAAARNGHEQVVQQIIQWLIRNEEDRFSRGAPVEETWTPLHWAVNYKTETTREALDILRNMIMTGASLDQSAGTGTSVTDIVQALKANSHEEDEKDLYSYMLDLLESPLRALRKPLQLVNPAFNQSGDVCSKFHANIVDFYASDGNFCTLERQSQIDQIIYNEEEGPDKVMKKAKTSWELDDIDLKHRFRWIHLPVNNWIWAKDLVTKISSEFRTPAGDYTELSNFVDLNRREHMGKPQSRFMYPNVTFESNDFHSGEGANIPRLRAEAKDKKRAEKGLQKDSETKEQEVAAPVVPISEATKPAAQAVDETKKTDNIQEHDQAGNEQKGTASKQGVDLTGGKPDDDDFEGRKVADPKPSDNLVIPERAQQKLAEAAKSTRKEADEKSEAFEKKLSLYSKGSKLSLCMPFLTFSTVKGHRDLRQAIRLAEIVGKSKPENNEVTEGSLLEHLPNKDNIQQARYEILQEEIYRGLLLLDDCGSEVFEKLDSCADRVADIMQTNGEKLLSSLRDIHGAIRRSSICKSPRILEWLESFLDAIEIVHRPENVSQSDLQYSLKQEALMEQYLQPGHPRGLHASRTLDQYYYAALPDTSLRDIDQVVRRYQARKKLEQLQESSKQRRSSFRERVEKIREQRGTRKVSKMEDEKEHDSGKENNDETWVDDPDAKIAMVDQLWLWIVDDGKNKTVITCFPRGSDEQSKNAHNLALLDKIRRHIHDESRPPISSVYHLATIITSFCIAHVEDCKARIGSYEDTLLQMFASSIGIVADEEVKCFETFKTDLDKSGSKNDVEKESVKLNIVKEITLLEEVKDIRDELNILRSIFEDQKALLSKLLKLVAERQLGGKQTPESDPVLNYYQERSDINLRIDKVKKMDVDATKTYESINHLLDLRQKNANLYEAVQAREQAEQSRVQAEETTKQGRIILVFTLVTIIFLPLSFLASLYALNVESYPHPSGNLTYPSNWIFPRIFGTSAAIGIPLIGIAIYVNEILEWYEKHIKPRWENGWGKIWNKRHLEKRGIKFGSFFRTRDISVGYAFSNGKSTA